jgi:cellulose biosynthesis protein BcsQ
MIVVYCSEEGGSGKTTLCVEYAVWAFDQGMKVAVIDADRQLQAGHWLKVAEPGIAVREVSTVKEAKRAVSTLRKTHELLLIDVPGKLEKESIAVLDEADIAIVPVMASPLDVRSSMVWSRNILSAIHRRHPGRPVVRFVISGIDRRTTVSREILDFADRMNPPALRTHIHRRAHFVNAADKTAVSRMGWGARRAATELARLFSEIAKLSEHPEKATQPRRAANE